MADMGKPGLGDAELLYFGDGFLQGKMGNMFFLPQCVEDDLFAAPDLLLFAVVDPVGIGDIGKIAEAEAQDGHIHVPYLDWDNGDISNDKGVFIDAVEPEVGDTGIFYVGEGIREFSYNHFLGHFVGVEIHRPALKEIVSSDIVESCEMVLMGMRKDHGVELADARPEHLITEIGRGIYDEGRGGRLNQDAGTKPFVIWIGGSAYFAGAGNHGNARAGAGTQERDF